MWSQIQPRWSFTRHDSRRVVTHVTRTRLSGSSRDVTPVQRTRGREHARSVGSDSSAIRRARAFRAALELPQTSPVLSITTSCWHHHAGDLCLTHHPHPITLPVIVELAASCSSSCKVGLSTSELPQQCSVPHHLQSRSDLPRIHPARHSTQRARRGGRYD